MKSHKYLIAGSLVAVLIIAVFLLVVLPSMLMDDSAKFKEAGALYSSSVDLANEGKYTEALDASDKALKLNVTSMTGLIQSNRAGILVMMNRNEEAIAASDAALAVEGNLTAVHSIAWYNKGNALYALGRISDAQSAYDHAIALDNTLIPPDMSNNITATPTRVILVTSIPKKLP